MEFYSDKHMHVSSELRDFISRQGVVYDIDAIKDLKWNDLKKRFELVVKWKGFSDFENTTESFLDFFKQVPVLCLNFLSTLFSTNRALVESLVVSHHSILRREVVKRKLSMDFYPFFKKRGSVEDSVFFVME